MGDIGCYRSYSLDYKVVCWFILPRALEDLPVFLHEFRSKQGENLISGAARVSACVQYTAVARYAAVLTRYYESLAAGEAQQMLLVSPV